MRLLAPLPAAIASISALALLAPCCTELQPQTTTYFNTTIAPILTNTCARGATGSGCHSSDAKGNAFGNLDLPMIMAAVMYASVFVVGANAVVDVLYATLDPRVRTSRA